MLSMKDTLGPVVQASVMTTMNREEARIKVHLLKCSISIVELRNQLEAISLVRTSCEPFWYKEHSKHLKGV